jgi:hypothetical protein
VAKATKNKKSKEGRHVGLDFYDLLIEGDYKRRNGMGKPGRSGSTNSQLESELGLRVQLLPGKSENGGISADSTGGEG